MGDVSTGRVDSLAFLRTFRGVRDRSGILPALSCRNKVSKATGRWPGTRRVLGARFRDLGMAG